MNQALLSVYQQNIALANQKIKYFQQKVNLFSAFRLVCFGFFLALVYWSVKLDSLGLFAVGAAVTGVLFNWLVARQGWFDKQKHYYQDFETVNQNEIAGISLQHDNIYYNGSGFSHEQHYYTSDLDVFGPASLYQFINRTATTTGRQKLAQWMMAPAPKPEILSRQEAIKELKDKCAWKLEMQARLLFAARQSADELPRLYRYLHTPVNIPAMTLLSRYSVIMPVVMLTAIALSFFVPYVNYLVTGIAVLNFFITGVTHKHTQQTDLIAGKIGASLNNYADIFACIEQQTWQANYNRQLAGTIKSSGGKSTSAVIRQLSGLINSLNNRNNMLVGFFLNVVLLWNVKYVLAIERWKRANHQNIEAAFDAVGGFEALFSLAGLHINYPEWCIPQIADGAGYTLTARAVAHPLIKADARVANDYELNNTRKIDIITGSNMAGKSTFLRTLGINTVLALAGAPVCAQSMQVSVVQLFSYMRIKDSLNESTSTFKAELDRLQMLLKAVEGQPNILFLIDEMLRGTNSVDKYLGSKAVIEKLIAQQGVGLVATHDLQLARLEDPYPHYIRNYYFDIQVYNGEMLFDYKLKPGECKTFNASLLLERIGIFR